MAQITELRSKATLFLLALVLLLRSAAGTGSPRWEDDRDATQWTSLVRLRPFFVQVDESRMCRSDIDNVIFYDQNDCKGLIAGSTIPTPGKCFRNTRWLARRDDCWVPEVPRSVLIRKGFPIGGTITVCDNPSTCFEDGYTRITYKKRPITVLPKLVKELMFTHAQFPQSTPLAYCINTFEHSYEDLWVRVEYEPGVMVGGLDGSVSRVGACKPNQEGNPQSDENTMPYDHLDSSDS